MEVNRSREHKLIREDIAKIGKQIEGVIEGLERVPTRDEFPQLLEKTFQFAILKTEHELMKKIIREKLHADI